jgi:hypothetical protein
VRGFRTRDNVFVRGTSSPGGASEVCYRCTGRWPFSASRGRGTCLAPFGPKARGRGRFLPRMGVMGKVIPPVSECIAKNRIGAQPLAERHVARFITQEAPMCTLVHENSQAFAPSDYARSSMPPYARGAED